MIPKVYKSILKVYIYTKRVHIIYQNYTDILKAYGQKSSTEYLLTPTTKNYLIIDENYRRLIYGILIQKHKRHFEEYPSKIYRQLGMHRHTSCARKMAQDSQLLAYELSMVYCRWPACRFVGWRAWRAKSLTLSCQRFTHGTLLTDTWVIGKQSLISWFRRQFVGNRVNYDVFKNGPIERVHM